MNQTTLILFNISRRFIKFKLHHSKNSNFEYFQTSVNTKASVTISLNSKPTDYQVVYPYYSINDIYVINHVECFLGNLNE